MLESEKFINTTPAIQKERILNYFIKLSNSNNNKSIGMMYNGKDIIKNLDDFLKKRLKQEVTFENKIDKIKSDDDLEKKVASTPNNSFLVYNSVDKEISYLNKIPKISDKIHNNLLVSTVNDYFRKNDSFDDVKKEILESPEISFALIASQYVANSNVTMIADTSKGKRLYQFSKVSPKKIFDTNNGEIKITRCYDDKKETFYLKQGRVRNYSKSKIEILGEKVEFTPQKIKREISNYELFN